MVRDYLKGRILRYSINLETKASAVITKRKITLKRFANFVIQKDVTIDFFRNIFFIHYYGLF